MTSINTNLSSLIVQKNLTQSTNALNQAIERLTTGFKINHASDNAANYSISESMSSKLSSYFVAEENTSMGLDLIRTQSSTLDTIQNLTTRLRALAEQAHNGTYGAQSLAAINQEADAIISEIERIGNNAEYNGIKLFDNALSQAGIPQLKSNGLMQEIEQRDTSSMTRLADVDIENFVAGTYSISSAEELVKLATIKRLGKVTSGSEFVLGADIDLSEYLKSNSWREIDFGSYGNTTKTIFDGNGYTISNLKGENSLFGSVLYAEIKNLKLIDCDIKCETRDVGGLITEFHNSKISNCTVTGNVMSQSCAGLIASRNIATNDDSTIEYCYTDGSVKSNLRAGGILGQVKNSIIKSCYSSASVEAVMRMGQSSSALSGGIAGEAIDTKIQNCASSGNIFSDDCAGGLVSDFYGYTTGIYAPEINNCVFTGTVVSKGTGYPSGILVAYAVDSNISGFYDSSIGYNHNLIGETDNSNVSVKILHLNFKLV